MTVSFDFKGNSSPIKPCFSLTIVQFRFAETTATFNCREDMADLLQKAIQAMSLEEEEPLVLLDSPRFRVMDENKTTLLGRLLNPDCQPMAKMIDYMPTAWRVYGRVRGMALSRDRFQFVFDREEDLETVLKDRPWSYNYWSMTLERWTDSPPDTFLQSMMVWIRIRNIPANYFTLETMNKLAGEVGKVEKVEYDPKVSHTKDYVRALILLDTNNPAKAYRKLTVKGGTVTIKFEFEKLHKRCFHCLRLTHEKAKCPFVNKGAVSRAGKVPEGLRVEQRSLVPMDRLDGPPGFPVMFPELSDEDRKMAMMYISHANPTERLARIERVKQGIAENPHISSDHLPGSSRETIKEKEHTLSYTKLLETQHYGDLRMISAPPPRDSVDNSTLFPELSVEDRKMAMLYIFHADDTERLARIERVKQGIAENAAESSLRLSRITNVKDKGKSHALTFPEPQGKKLKHALPMESPEPFGRTAVYSDEESVSSGSHFSFQSAPIIPTPVFLLGPSSEGLTIGNSGIGKPLRKRPQAWKRRFTTKPGTVAEVQDFSSLPLAPTTSKRKSVTPLDTAENKNQKLSNHTGASVLKPLPPPPPMSILSWNCRGTGSAETVRHLRGLRRKVFPDLIFLMETKQKSEYMLGLKKSLGYDHMLTVEPVGLSGGLAVLWKDSFHIDVISSDLRIIDLKVKFGSCSFFLSCVYGDPVVARRKEVWDRLVDVGLLRDEAWLLVGDFNELLSNEEKSGGVTRSDKSLWDFRNMLQNCKLKEMKSSGNQLSWAGVREDDWVQCKLDRSLGNSEWFSSYPRSNCEYLELWASDHRPIHISFALERENLNKRRFFFDKKNDLQRRF